ITPTLISQFVPSTSSKASTLFARCCQVARGVFSRGGAEACALDARSGRKSGPALIRAAAAGGRFAASGAAGVLGLGSAQCTNDVTGAASRGTGGELIETTGEGAAGLCSAVGFADPLIFAPSTGLLSRCCPGSTNGFGGTAGVAGIVTGAGGIGIAGGIGAFCS